MSLRDWVRDLIRHNNILSTIQMNYPQKKSYRNGKLIKNQKIPRLKSLGSNALISIFYLTCVFMWEIFRSSLCNDCWSWALNVCHQSTRAVGDSHGETEIMKTLFWFITACLLSSLIIQGQHPLKITGKGNSACETLRHCCHEHHGKTIRKWIILCPKHSLNNRQ